MKLSKEGYGSIQEIRSMDIGTFMNLIHYERYLDQYAHAVRGLNKK
nr:MAG TPA: hypothetical protein [Caudoviricetes sp.]